jgi:hypothetical protein
MKKNIFAFLIFVNLTFGSEILPEVKIESLKTATIVKKEEKKQKVEIKVEPVKKSVSSYSSRQIIRCTSGFG